MEIEDWVTSCRIDLALALLPEESATLEAVPLVETEAVAVLSQGNPLNVHKALSHEALQNETVKLPSRQPLRTRIDATMAAGGQTLEAQFEATSAITAARLAASGLGVALCDAFDSVSVLPWKPTIRLTYGAVYNKAYGLEPKVELLLDLLRDAFHRE